MKSSLIILTLNEIEGVKALFDRIPMKTVDSCLVIDGGSTDGTIEFFEAHDIPVTSFRQFVVVGKPFASQ